MPKKLQEWISVSDVGHTIQIIAITTTINCAHPLILLFFLGSNGSKKKYFERDGPGCEIGNMTYI